MVPLTFAISDETICNDDLSLTPCSLCDISEAMWEDLAAQIARERRLIPCPATILARRCSEGYAATVVCDGRIVHYGSFVPIVGHTAGPNTWAALTAGSEENPAALPRIDVFELATGWTAPAWRGKGINQTLRGQLIDRYVHGDALGISGMAGVSSPVHARMGWQILAWDAASFVTSLIAVPASDFPAQAALGWRPPDGLKLYQGPQRPLDDLTHPWEQFCHCLVSNTDIALHLDRELATLMRGDLDIWRSVVVAAFTTPESLHRLAFLS